MDMALIIETVKVVLFIIVGGVAIIFTSTTSKLPSKAMEFIAEAEREYTSYTKAGGIKFNYVTRKLYGWLPTWMRIFITEDMVRAIIQRVFDTIEGYAKVKLNKAMDVIADKLEEGESDATETGIAD